MFFFIKTREIKEQGKSRNKGNQGTREIKEQGKSRKAT